MAVQVIYRRTEQVWIAAQEHASKRGMSLSNYVEVALSRFNAANDGSGYEVLPDVPRKRGRKPKIENDPEKLQRTLDKIRQWKKNL